MARSWIYKWTADKAPSRYSRRSPLWCSLNRAAQRGTGEVTWPDWFSAILPIGSGGAKQQVEVGPADRRRADRRGFALTRITAAPAMLELFQRTLPNASAHLIDVCELARGIRFSELLARDSFFHLTRADGSLRFTRSAGARALGTSLMFTSGHGEGSAVCNLNNDRLYLGSLHTSEHQIV